MEYIFSLLLGIGLASAVGFRVFIPLFFIGISARLGMWELSENFMWMSSTPALIVFAIATLAESGAYFIPVIDNFLDSISLPLAGIAGTIAMGSMAIEMDPYIKWTFAIIAGGGTAGIIKGTSSITRALSTTITAGFGNPLISVTEFAGAVVLSIMAVVKFVLSGILGLAIVIFVIWFLVSNKKSRAKTQT